MSTSEEKKAPPYMKQLQKEHCSKLCKTLMDHSHLVFVFAKVISYTLVMGTMSSYNIHFFLGSFLLSLSLYLSLCVSWRQPTTLSNDRIDTWVTRPERRTKSKRPEGPQTRSWGPEGP